MHVQHVHRDIGYLAAHQAISCGLCREREQQEAASTIKKASSMQKHHHLAWEEYARSLPHFNAPTACG